MNKFSRALIIPMRARRANDHDVARLQAKTIPKNLIWSEWAPVVAEFRRPQDSRSPYRAHGHANYTSIEKWPWFAHLHAKTVPMNLIRNASANWLLGYGIRKIPGALIMAMGMPITPPRANNHGVAHLPTKTVQMSLIWSESAQWLWTRLRVKILPRLWTLGAKAIVSNIHP